MSTWSHDSCIFQTKNLFLLIATQYKWLKLVKKLRTRKYFLEKPLDHIFFLSIWDFSHNHSRITGPQGKGEGISLTPHYHFHPLHRHLDVRRAITAESSPLHIDSSRTRTGNLCFPSASQSVRAQVKLDHIHDVIYKPHLLKRYPQKFPTDTMSWNLCIVCINK